MGPAQAAVKSSKTTTNSNSVNTSQMKSMSITGGTKIEVSDIELEETFKCTGMELFNALTQPEMIQVFTQNPVKMASDAKAGVEFTLLDGSINGTYINVTPYTKISQSWRLKSWPAGHFSEVTIKITQTKEDTKLSLTQKGVPIKEMSLRNKVGKDTISMLSNKHLGLDPHFSRSSFKEKSFINLKNNDSLLHTHQMSLINCSLKLQKKK